MRELIARNNTRHKTIEDLDAAIGYQGQLRTLIATAQSRGRLPRAEVINAIADELEDVHPVQVLLAFGRDAGVRMPQSAHTTDVWTRMLKLPLSQRVALIEVLETLAAEFVRANEDGGDGNGDGAEVNDIKEAGA